MKKTYKIGDTIYSYNSKILEYKIIGTKILESENYNKVFYFLQCQSCNDHDKCEISVKIDDYGDLEYSHMLNNYEEYDEDSSEYHKNSQYYWHRGGKFFDTREKAVLHIHKKNLEYYNEEIKKKEESIEKLKKSIEETKVAIELLEAKKV